MAEFWVAARWGKCTIFFYPGRFTWLWTLSLQSSAVPRERGFWLVSTELAGWLSVAGLKPKRIWQEDKVSMLTAVQLFTGEVIFTLNGLRSVLVHDVMSSCGAVCIVKNLTFSSPINIWWILKRYFKRGLLNRICGFHLVIERNGYFVYFFFCCTDYFVIKPRWSTVNCSKNDHISCWRTFALFFLIGTENVKQNHIVLNETTMFDDE